MDALEILRTDHEKLKNLVKRFIDSPSHSERIRTFNELKNELRVHSHAEETVFYPVFAKYQDTQEVARRLKEEHEDMRRLIAQVSTIARDEKEFQERAQDLLSLVENHIVSEESQLFPRVRQIMRRPEREQLGRHLAASKNEVPAAA